MNRSQILTQCRGMDNLNDTGTIWTDANLNKILDNVVVEIQQRKALQQEACLPITGKTIDISSLSRMIKVYRVQTPVSDDGPTIDNRNYMEYGTTLKLDLATSPTITSGVLAGTVTFTKGPQAVTGVATVFSTVLKAGDLIGKSGGAKFYVISSIASATALTLDLPFEEETGADTINVTKYRDYKSCARVYYGKEYTVTRSIPAFYGTGLNDLTAGHGYSGTGELSYKVEIDANGAPDTFKWSDDGGATWDFSTVNCATTAVALNNGLSVLWAASTGHTIGDYWTFIAKPNDMPGVIEPILITGTVAKALLEFAAVLTDVETALDLPNLASTGELTVGRAKINTLNLGGPGVAPAYAQYAQVDLAEAQARILKMRELKALGALKYQEYQRGLSTLIRLSDYAKFSCSRE